MLTIFQAETPSQIAMARELMLEYARQLEFNLCFQDFEEELRNLPGDYAPPRGRLLLAFCDNAAAGLCGLRPLKDAAACEMKRLYVRTDFRGRSVGRALVSRLIAEAFALGYKYMRLDTIPGQMDHAIALYREFGFKETQPYYGTPLKQTIFMELELRPGL